VPDVPSRDARQFIQGSAVLHVPDVGATAEYYRDVLGFTYDYGADHYGVVWRENAAVHLMQGELGGGCHLFFWLEDLDAYCDEIRERGATIVAEPEDQPYGLREFAAVDCNGVRLVFGMDLD
jgi:predicted enzyme related to lactoylglutathione lyase